MDYTTEINSIQTNSDWHNFFLAHPELCEDPNHVTDSDGKYLLATQKYLARSTTDLQRCGLIDDSAIEALRASARRVAEWEMAEEQAADARAIADEAEIARLSGIMTAAHARGDARVCLSRSGRTVIFASADLGLGRRDLSGIPERASAQLRHAGLM